MLGIIALEPALEERVVGGDVIVPALPSLPWHDGFDAQNTAMHLPRAENTTCPAKQMDLCVEQVEFVFDGAPRDGVTEAGFQFAYPLECGGPDLRVFTHVANPA